MNCSPQRFLANDRNLWRSVTVTPSSVLPVANKVVPIPFRKKGTAQARLTDTYTGFEQADYEFEILDTDIDTARVSTPTFSGAGSGTLGGITATGAAQTFTLECANAGIQGKAAAATVDGALLKWSVEGTAGNAGRISVDQSGLSFADTDFSTLQDLQAGQGSQASPLVGQGFDWNAVQLGADGLIPTTAKRIAFADDPTTVYLSYKDYVDGGWKYYLIPQLSRSVPKGTRIQFVTGGRTVAITNGVSTEISPDPIVTDYDFLYWVRTTSELVVVDGVVTNDRSPTGQASREFSLHTEAHAEVSSGSGSSYATGFTNVTVAPGAGTQLVTAECFAVNGTDNPNARLGHTLWDVQSSLLGSLGVVSEGVPFNFGDFAGLIPVKLPPGYGQDKGSIGATVTYTTRTGEETEPPICFPGLRLGADATDKSVTFRYAPEPSGDCRCDDLPGPNLSQSCLGVPSEGGASVSYQPDTNVKLTAMRAWFYALVDGMTLYPTLDVDVSHEAAAIGNPVDGPPISADVSTQYAQQTESLKKLVDDFEATIALIDPLEPSSPPGYREAGMTAWDAAFLKLQDDIAATVGGSSPPSYFLRNIPSDRYVTRLSWALASAGIPNVGKADASTVSGDGCWRDFGGSRWVDVSGVYAPLWSNKPFYFVKQATNGKLYSTHEAGGMIAVKCPEDLKYGDEITFNILNAGWGTTYQKGDKLEMGIVSASALPFTGGVTASPEQSWTLRGSVDGAFPVCTFNPDVPVAYSGTIGGTTVGFLLAQGGIPYAKGDRYRWVAEGGHFRWRKNGGAWDGTSPPLSIPVGSVVIDSGLSLSYDAGAAPSFVTGDVSKFRALQPWAASNLQRPTSTVTKWDGSAATFESGDLGASVPVTMFALVHGLPEGSTVTLWGGPDATATAWSESVTWRAGIMTKTMTQEARYLRLEIADATGGSIQYAYTGDPVATSLSAEYQLRRDYRVNRPGGNLQGGRSNGKTVSGPVSWTEQALTEADVTALTAMLDHVKENDDEPIIFIPQITRSDALFALIDADAVEFPDHMAYNQNSGIERRVSASFPLQGVWQ